MAEMKGIKLCGECGNYDYKKHKCRIGCKDDSDAQASFYGDCPLPDVVPKSEVEVWKQNRFNLYQRLKLHEIARQKVAREIFEEIEKLILRYYNDGWCSVTDMACDVEMLKKKYTEGEANAE